MRHENLADCDIGDWVALMDAEELGPGENTSLQSWTAPGGAQWLFRLTEMPVEGGTLFGWVRE